MGVTCSPNGILFNLFTVIDMTVTTVISDVNINTPADKFILNIWTYTRLFYSNIFVSRSITHLKIYPSKKRTSTTGTSACTLYQTVQTFKKQSIGISFVFFQYLLHLMDLSCVCHIFKDGYANWKLYLLTSITF